MSNRTDQSILEIIKTEEPQRVEELVVLLQKKSRISREEAIRQIIKLHQNGKLKLKEQRSTSLLQTYIFNSNTVWYSVVILLMFMTSIMILAFPETGFLHYAKHIFGGIFVFFLPGYCLTRFLSLGSKNNYLEQIGLSICMSLGILLVVGLLLNQTLGIDVTSVAFSLIFLTAIFATATIILEQVKQSKEPEDIPKFG